MKMPKIGDTVKILSVSEWSSDIFNSLLHKEVTVCSVDYNSRYPSFSLEGTKYRDGSGPVDVFCDEARWEIMSEANPEKSSTTTAEVEMQEVQDITHSISEAIFYDGFEAPKVLAKANDVVGALITIMVAKGIITKQDVKRILASPRPSV